MPCLLTKCAFLWYSVLMKLALFSSLRLAFGMYSVIPVGKPEWNQRASKFIMLFFPLVGVLIAALETLWIWAAHTLELPGAVRALGITLIPPAISGGIHLDGFADTCDALSSHAGPERRREILKDSHTGAFAVIGLIIWFLCYYSFASAYPSGFRLGGAAVFGAGFLLSRLISASLAVSLPSGTDGYVKMFRDGRGKSVFGLLVSGIVIVLAAVIYLWRKLTALNTEFSVLSLAALIVIQSILTLYLVHMAKKKFEGMSGDLAGWFLCMFEVLWLGVIALAGTVSD